MQLARPYFPVETGNAASIPYIYSMCVYIYICIYMEKRVNRGEGEFSPVVSFSREIFEARIIIGSARFIIVQCW